MGIHSEKLLDRAIMATVAAIEIYNKPTFLYREETFAVLAINGWELLLKAKWLTNHDENVESLHVTETRVNRDGSQDIQIKKTRSGNPFTHSLDYLAKKLVETKAFDANALANIQALLEMRDSSIHFYNRSRALPVRLQEIGMASLKNFAAATKSWFGRDLSEFNFYLMPLSFITLPQQTEAIVLNQEESTFLTFIESLESSNDDETSPYYVTVNINIKLTRSNAKKAAGINVSNNPDAPKVQLTDEQLCERYPWSYTHLTAECRTRYSDFKLGKKYHRIRKQLVSDKRFGYVRLLDPSKSKGARKQFFHPNILQELDKHYTKK